MSCISAIAADVTSGEAPLSKSRVRVGYPDSVAEAVVAVRGLTKRFGAIAAVDGVDLDVHAAEVLALLGPSGCGKTTTLRLIAGFDRPDAGAIVLDGEEVAGSGRFVPAGAPARRRRVPGLRPVPAPERGRATSATASSGAGRTERVAADARPRRARRRWRPAARTSSRAASSSGWRSPGRSRPSPRLVLLDEPFSNLDAALRADVRAEVRAILAAADATTVVRHARPGGGPEHRRPRSRSCATGRSSRSTRRSSVYARPDERFVATFVGDADLLPGQADDGHVTTAIGALALEAPVRSGAVDVVVRPERVRLRLDSAGEGVVAEITFFGHDQLIEVASRRRDARAVAHWGRCAVFEPGDRVSVSVSGNVIAYPHGAVHLRVSGQRVCVLGAGPAGLGAALLLARRGHDVTVLERAPAPGGLAASFEVAGVRVDHGSHRLHRSCPPEILDELRAELGDDLQLRRRNGRIRLGGRWVALPAAHRRPRPAAPAAAHGAPRGGRRDEPAPPRREPTRSRRSSGPASAPRCSTSSTRPTWRRSGASPPPT